MQGVRQGYLVANVTAVTVVIYLLMEVDSFGTLKASWVPAFGTTVSYHEGHAVVVCATFADRGQEPSSMGRPPAP
jgi:hypothetical protein